MDISEIVNNKDRILLLVGRSELDDIAENIVSRILAAVTKPIPKEENEKLLTQPEAIRFLGKTRQTLIKWRKDNIITAYRLGGRIYFKESELISALKQLGK